MLCYITAFYRRIRLKLAFRRLRRLTSASRGLNPLVRRWKGITREAKINRRIDWEDRGGGDAGREGGREGGMIRSHDVEDSGIENLSNNGHNRNKKIQVSNNSESRDKAGSLCICNSGIFAWSIFKWISISSLPPPPPPPSSSSSSLLPITSIPSSYLHAHHTQTSLSSSLSSSSSSINFGSSPTLAPNLSYYPSALHTSLPPALLPSLHHRMRRYAMKVEVSTIEDGFGGR